METMNTTQKNTFIKETATTKLGLANLCASDEAYQIDTFTYAIPVDVEGTTRYAKVTITACSDKEVKYTKGSRAGQVNKAFDLNEAIAAYEAKLDAQATALAEREAKKAAKNK